MKVRPDAQGVVAAIVVLVSPAAASAEPFGSQPLTPAQRAACRPLLRALVRPVAAPHQAEALALLRSQSAGPLDDSRAAELIGLDPPPTGALADRLLKDAIDALLDRRDNAVGEHALKWSVSEQSRLDALISASAAPHAALKAVLVRAVASSGAGLFDAAVCGDGLAVRRLESEAAAAASPAAVIVFVERAPAVVQAWREEPAR